MSNNDAAMQRAISQFDDAEADAIIDKIESIRAQEALAINELREMLGRAGDHRSGMRHRPELCSTCAKIGGGE